MVNTASVLGDTYVQSGAQSTGGADSLWEMTAPEPTVDPPRIIHEREDVASYILTLSFL
jgi:hypothetical protein